MDNKKVSYEKESFVKGFGKDIESLVDCFSPKLKFHLITAVLDYAMGWNYVINTKDEYKPKIESSFYYFQNIKWVYFYLFLIYYL